MMIIAGAYAVAFVLGLLAVLTVNVVFDLLLMKAFPNADDRLTRFISSLLTAVLFGGFALVMWGLHNAP